MSERPQAQSDPSLPLSSKNCSFMLSGDRQRQVESHTLEWGLLTLLYCLHRLHTLEATVQVTALLQTLTVPVTVTLG